jgi:hypothetical protein
MRAKSTTQQGRRHEETMVRLLDFDNARRSRSSGASWNDNVDVVGDHFALECESTYNKSYSLKLSFWEEVVAKSTANRIPLLGIEYAYPDQDKSVKLVVMSADDFAELLEIYKMYRENGL